MMDKKRINHEISGLTKLENHALSSTCRSGIDRGVYVDLEISSSVPRNRVDNVLECNCLSRTTLDRLAVVVRLPDGGQFARHGTITF